MSDLTITPITMYEVDGKHFNSLEGAEEYVSRRAIEDFLNEEDQLYFSSGSSSTRDIAEYLIKRKQRLIELLTAIK
jgi:hypothetical protein